MSRGKPIEYPDFPIPKEQRQTCGQEFGTHCPPSICDCHAPEKELGAYSSVGDINSTAKGSGARYNGGKADLSLIPLSTLEDEARVWMYGKEKYAAWNWAKGMAWSVPFACAMRHLAAWQAGQDIDEESGQPHLAHAMCNLRMLTLYSKNYLEGDDRPPKELMP